MIWEKFPQIIFTIETWHSLIWHLILMMQQHSSSWVYTNDCLIQCNLVKVILFKKINNTLIFHPSIMILVLQAGQLISSEHLGSLRAQSQHHKGSLRLSQLSGAQEKIANNSVIVIVIGHFSTNRTNPSPQFPLPMLL